MNGFWKGRPENNKGRKKERESEEGSRGRRGGGRGPFFIFTVFCIELFLASRWRKVARLKVVAKKEETLEVAEKTPPWKVRMEARRRKWDEIQNETGGVIEAEWLLLHTSPLSSVFITVLDVVYIYKYIYSTVLLLLLLRANLLEL